MLSWIQEPVKVIDLSRCRRQRRSFKIWQMPQRSLGHISEGANVDLVCPCADQWQHLVKEHSGYYIESCLRIPNNFKWRPSHPPAEGLGSLNRIYLHSRKILGGILSDSYVFFQIFHSGMIYHSFDSSIHPRLVSWCRIQAASKKSGSRNEQSWNCTLQLGENANSEEDLLKPLHIFEDNCTPGK
jgi:hypothetical protein